MKEKKSVGRPPMPENERRSIYVSVNCNEEELKMIKRKAKQYKLRQTEFIRFAIEKLK